MDIERLEHIVAYRACGMSLSQIGELLDDPGASRAAHLSRQLEILNSRIDDVTRQRAAVMRKWEAMTMSINLDPKEYFEVFGTLDPQQYAQETEERWGGTDPYIESQRRTSEYTKDDWLRARSEWEAVTEEWRSCLAAGLPADGDEAMTAAEAHRRHINQWYYPCSFEMQAGLADMYVADPRFRANYDDVLPGLAEYVRDAIYANALRS